MVCWLFLCVFIVSHVCDVAGSPGDVPVTTEYYSNDNHVSIRIADNGLVQEMKRQYEEQQRREYEMDLRRFFETTRPGHSARKIQEMAKKLADAHKASDFAQLTFRTDRYAHYMLVRHPVGWHFFHQLLASTRLHNINGYSYDKGDLKKFDAYLQFIAHDIAAPQYIPNGQMKPNVYWPLTFSMGSSVQYSDLTTNLTCYAKCYVGYPVMLTGIPDSEVTGLFHLVFVHLCCLC